MLFVCENNLYMEYTPIALGDRGDQPRRRPRGGVRHPGRADRRQRRLLVRDAVAAAADRARAGGGPTIIEALTYRHFGHSRTDPATYRPPRRSSVARARSARRRPGPARRARCGAEQIAAADDRAERLVADAVAAAKAAPAADPADALTDVWADGGAAWRT